MKRLLTSLLILGGCLSFQALAVDSTQQLATQAKQERVTQKKYNQQREALFNKSEQELKQLKSELEAKKSALDAQNTALAQTFSANEETLANLEQQLRLETGSLGEVFGVVRQSAKSLQAEQQLSVSSIDANQYIPVVNDIVAATKLPSMDQLTGLWFAFNEQIQASGQIRQVMLPFRTGTGTLETVPAARLGAYGVVGEQGYLRWSNERSDAQDYSKQPEPTPTLTLLSDATPFSMQSVVIDPSRGVILEQLALSPTWQDRLAAGGVVGKIILGLLIVGLLIALIRGVALTLTRIKIKKQLKTPQQPGKNPLGRVLSAYDKDKVHSAEALELRLLEVVVDEQADLEKGLSMLKLLAALAPMLGLLGTVTGMIETFQVITQFGNADPKVMAGGISMALVTTVLGLIAAMPLLLAHNILSSQAESIRNVLEKQGIGLVAEQAELDHSQPMAIKQDLEVQSQGAA
ncbi:MotA/TolQ/ExbB proton channel family protein [Vibrio hippocampi]|uniref:Tol-Pal system protein TolQ n=1 Tax=Vibrio hippocampi TaxID=654686 RepID=A0ABM8ZLJ4_9VIBR|nr:MotA/TolQ/ExbB proton channel family protein [Vibrio hippocampi]CAH0529112.1 Tol-Pal system protein TolQ [Vibrio hippocampi]